MGLDDGELDLAKASLRGRVENMFDSFDDNHIKEQHTLETIKEGSEVSIFSSFYNSSDSGSRWLILFL